MSRPRDAAQGRAGSGTSARTISSAATTLALVRDGTIFVGGRTEIDFRTPDYSVWLTIKGDDGAAEAVAAALEATFGGDDAAS